MSLRLRVAETEHIHAHLCRAYPEEGCGVLLGRDRGGVRDVEQVIALENQRPDSRQSRYVIAPEQFLEAERRAREAGLDVIGFFHSHPDHPAEPSAFDLEHAWPYYAYLIASVRNREVREMRSWRLADDRSRFDPEDLIVAAEGGGAGEALGRGGERR